MTLEELKALYKEKGATEERHGVSEQGDTVENIPIQYGDGWTAWEKSPVITGYQDGAGGGEGGDQPVPIYSTDKQLGGFSKQEGDYITSYDLAGNVVGREKWNYNMLKQTIKDLGPLAMAAITMGGGGAFLGNSLFGLTGSAASAAGGALAGGINAYGNDQDILKGALLGGVSGAGTAKLSDILGADALGGTFKNATLGDVTKAINFAKDPTLAGAANLASPYIDTNIKLGDTGFTTNDVLKGLNTVQALSSGNDKKVFDAITGLAKTYGSNGRASSGVDQSTVGNFDDNEVTRLKNLGYNNDQIKAYFGRLENLTSIFDEEDKGIPVNLGSKSLSSVDQTASNVVDANDTVNVTGNRSNDALLDFLSLNNPVGNTSNNYTNDLSELVVTGNKNGTSLDDFLTLNDIVGDTTNNYVDNGTVLVTGKTDKDDDDVPELVVDDKKDNKCAPGFHDDGTGLCVADDDVKEDGCPEGYILDLATNQCVKLDDTKVTVPPKKVVTPKVDTTKKTKKSEDLMDSLGLNRQVPSQDPYANIKSMEDLFGGDIAYKLRALGVNPSQKTASADMDELVKLLRG